MVRYTYECQICGKRFGTGIPNYHFNSRMKERGAPTNQELEEEEREFLSKNKCPPNPPGMNPNDISEKVRFLMSTRNLPKHQLQNKIRKEIEDEYYAQYPQAVRGVPKACPLCGAAKENLVVTARFH